MGSEKSEPRDQCGESLAPTERLENTQVPLLSRWSHVGRSKEVQRDPQCCCCPVHRPHPETTTLQCPLRTDPQNKTQMHTNQLLKCVTPLCFPPASDTKGPQVSVLSLVRLRKGWRGQPSCSSPILHSQDQETGALTSPLPWANKAARTPGGGGPGSTWKLPGALLSPS